MVNITFSLPTDTVERLRRIARAKGRRGSISEIVNTALSEHLSELEATASQEQFFALRGSEEVAQAGSLRELAKKLQVRMVDPRDVEIRSSIPVKPFARTGLRGGSS